MKHFVLLYTYHPDFMRLRAPHRAAHLAHAKASVERDELQLGGALVDEPLGLLWFKADSAQAVERFAAADPYVQNAVVSSYRIREWTTVVGRDAVTPL